MLELLILGRNVMKKKMNTVLVLVFLLMVMMSTTALAASNKSKALKAYKNYLTKNESHYWVRDGDWSSRNSESYKKTSMFLLVDLDKDGISELVAYHPVGCRNGKIYVYTYKSGKVKLAAVGSKPYLTGSAKYEISAPYYTGTWMEGYSCKKKHFHLRLGTGAGYIECVFTMKNGKIKSYAEHSWAMNVNTYWVNGKKVSAAKYNSSTKSCTRKMSFANNTSTKRKQYLK